VRHPSGGFSGSLSLRPTCCLLRPPCAGGVAGASHTTPPAAAGPLSFAARRETRALSLCASDWAVAFGARFSASPTLFCLITSKGCFRSAMAPRRSSLPRATLFSLGTALVCSWAAPGASAAFLWRSRSAPPPPAGTVAGLAAPGSADASAQSFVQSYTQQSQAGATPAGPGGQPLAENVLQIYSVSGVDEYAVCGDGSSGAYYYAPSPSGSNQWLGAFPRARPPTSLPRVSPPLPLPKQSTLRAACGAGTRRLARLACRARRLR
jgi:hypothetical protein